MNKIYKIFSSLVVSVLMLVACTPDDYSLGKVDVSPGDLVEGIAYTITHDSSNPNIVYLRSLMDSQYTPIWHHPQGNSQDQEVELKVAFEGTYPVQFGVETRGGIVYGDTVYFQIDDFYADFVSGEMWVNLAGGVGESKTWVPDNGSYGMKQGFYSCFDPTTTWEDMVADVEYDWYAQDKTWWQPSDSDIGNTEDDLLSYMTFSLDGKAGLTVYRYNNGEYIETEGTFNMNEENHTISAVGVDFLHGEWATGNAVDFRNGFQILVLTENQLMIGNYRDEALSGEGACLYCWNFVSKDWADNYVPDDTAEPEPPYDGDANDDLTTSQSTTKNWIINLDAPYNWTDLYGNFLNEWTVGANGIPEFVTWQPPYDEALLSTISITLSKGGSNDGTYEVTGSDGREYSGNYTIDDKNWIDFGQDIDIISGMDWINFSTQDGKLRIISVERTLSGAVSVMHLGRINEDNPNEYMTIALTQGSSSGGGSDNGALNGTVIAFDNSKLVYGDLEGNGTLRLEMYNIYGSGTANDPGFNLSDFQYDYTIQVTFTLSGVSFNNGAAGSYTGALSFASEDWNAQYWGGGAGDTVVTGDGTYTVWCQPGTGVGIAVFCIDISGMAGDINLSAVSATIDKIEIK